MVVCREVQLSICWLVYDEIQRGFLFHHFQEVLGIVLCPVQAASSPFSARDWEALWRRLSAVIRMEFLENFQGLLSPSVALNIGHRINLSFGIWQLCLVQDYWPSSPACVLFKLPSWLQELFCIQAYNKARRGGALGLTGILWVWLQCLFFNNEKVFSAFWSGKSYGLLYLYVPA